MPNRPPLIQYIIDHQRCLIQTDFCREIWMIPDRLSADYLIAPGDRPTFQITTATPMYIGKLFIYQNKFYGIISYERAPDRTHDELRTYHVVGHETGIDFDNNESTPLCTPQDPLLLQPGEIDNYPEGPALETTLGRFIANYMFLVYPFGNTISYLNEEITTEKLEKRVAHHLRQRDISVRDVKDRYVNILSLMGGSNDMICPNISEKTISIPQEIHDLRDKLVSENRDALARGDASVMSDIEKKLITAYRKHLEGDPSLHFLLKPKYFNVTLKKLFLTQGMVEVFGSPGKFTFVDNPMGKGWKIKDLPTIFNEVRAGSFARAVETADGGVIAKLILRVLQDTRIDIADCKTPRGEKVFTTTNNLKDFTWNYIIQKDGSNLLITPDNIPSLVGKHVEIRTPGYCQAKQGFCARCFGNTFEELEQKAFAPVANDAARHQVTGALKSMHGKSHNTADVSDLNKYLVG